MDRHFLRKARVSFLSVVGLLATIHTAIAQGGSVDAYIVANTQPPDAFVSLRTHPPIRMGSRITTMPNGTQLHVLKRQDDGWWNVRVVQTGQEGWALSGQGSRSWIVANRPPTGADRSRNDARSKESVAAALRSRLGAKLILRDGVMIGDYALQNWQDPVEDTGGQTLLRYEAGTQQWKLLDTDMGHEIATMVSHGVPRDIAVALTTELSRLESQRRPRPAR